VRVGRGERAVRRVAAGRAWGGGSRRAHLCGRPWEAGGAGARILGGGDGGGGGGGGCDERVETWEDLLLMLERAVTDCWPVRVTNSRDHGRFRLPAGILGHDGEK
jgi:hypothetical protein